MPSDAPPPPPPDARDGAPPPPPDARDGAPPPPPDARHGAPPPPLAHAPPPTPEAVPADPDPVGAGPAAEGPQRLHPFSMVRGIPTRQLLGSLPALAIFLTGNDLPLVFSLLGVAALLVVVAVLRVIAWTRHTYEFAGGRIIERSGIISRSERALEVARIQQVDVDRTLLDRVVGTCEVRLETAADSGDSELTLRVVSVEEARRLRSILADRLGAATDGSTSQTGDGDTTTAAPDPTVSQDDDFSLRNLMTREDEGARGDEEVLVSVPLRHVALAAVTGPRLLTIPAGIAVLGSIVFENAETDAVIDTTGDVVSGIGITAGIVLGLVALVISIIATAVFGVLRDGGFTIAQRGSDLRVRRGLSTTRSATVPLRRVQRVTITRRWVQGALGFASLTVHSAGGGGQSEGDLDRSLTVPLLPEQDVGPLVERLLGIATTPHLRRHPPAAGRRAVVQGALGGLPPAAGLVGIGFATGWSWLFAVAALPIVLGAAGGWQGHRRRASGADATTVAARTGFFGTTTELAPLRKTQGTAVTSSWFQRRRELASLEVRVAGPAGGISLDDIAADDAHDLAPELYA